MKISKHLPNIFGVVANILIIGYDNDRQDHDRRRQKPEVGNADMSLQNLKLNKNKYHLRCTKISFFRELISRESIHPDPKKLCTLTEMPLLQKGLF